MSSLQVQLLGDFHLTYKNETVAGINDARQQALLVYLLLHRDMPVPHRDLALHLWPALTVTAAVSTLDGALKDLLGAWPQAGRFLVLTPDAVQWQPDAPYTVDIIDFEAALVKAQAAPAGDAEATEQQLLYAVRCYHGDLLPACKDDWITAERGRLHALYLDALLRLLPILEQKREYAQAVEFSRVLRRHSLQYEPLHRRLTHLHVLSGGRAGLLQVLEQRLAALARGQGALVLIQGVAGIGKTSLALVCEEQAHRLGARFVSGHCYERGVTSPFMPWQEALATLVATMGVDLTVLPEPFGQGPPAQSAHQLIQAITARLYAAAKQPLVLLLDDLHWADQDSLDLLDFATRHLTDVPLLILVTYRSEEVHRDRPLSSFLPALQRNRPVETIRLEALSLDDTMRLVEAYHGPCSPQLASYLYERAEGHPLFLVQLLNDLAERNLMAQDAGGRWLPPAQTIPVPTLLQQVIVERVARLGPQAEQFLEVAAVVGETWDLAVVEAVLSWPEEQLLAVLEQALAAGVIATTDLYTEWHRFGHGLIREVLYNRQLARRRKQLHGRIATLLAARRPVDAAALAHHAYLAEHWQQTHQYSLEAGDAARRRYAMHSAVQFYRQALDAVQMLGDGVSADVFVQLYERLGETYTTLNHKEEALTVFTLMAESARSAGNLPAQGRALSQLGVIQSRLYQLDQARTTSKLALQVAEQVHDQHLLALNHLSLSHLYLVVGDMPPAWRHLEQAERYARTIDEYSLIADALRYQGFLSIWSAEYTRAEQLSLEALHFTQAANKALGLAAIPFVIAFARIELGEYERARQTIYEGLIYAEQLGERLHYLAKLLNVMGYLHLELGDIDSARQWNQRALDASRYEGGYYNIESACYALLDLATGQLLAGNLVAALAYIAEFESIQSKTEYARFRFLNRFQLLQAELALARNEFDLALRHVVEAQQYAKTKNMPKNVTKSLLYQGQALMGLGQVQEAEKRLQRAVDLADQIGHAALRWQSRLRLAQTYASLARPNADLYEQALAIVEGLATNLSDERLRGCFLTSPLVIELRANAQSAIMLQQPQALTPLQAAKLAYGGLTRREREVAALIAQGKSNRAIAEILVLGERTVEGYVSNIFSKLGFSSRTQIAAWAVKMGLANDR